jgi:argininosuccinate lyase
MPQKRNPFLLEHVKGRAAVASGAFVTAATAMHATPFANSVAVSTEACAGVTAAVEATADAAALLAYLLAGARPEPAAMDARLRAGQTTATALAEQLAATGTVSFREAHRSLGRTLREDGSGSVLDAIDPEAVVSAARFGSGPGAVPLPALDTARHRRAELIRDHTDRTRRWRAAAADLDQAAAALASPPARARTHTAVLSGSRR